MTNRNSVFAAIVAAFAASAPAAAAGAEIIITHAKAVAGNITPGDAPGYPVTLSRAGSYRLGGNLIPGVGKDGIEITAAYVTLDMNGFTLNGSGVAKDGISGNADGARIENGTIINFKGIGIHGTGGNMWTVENMLVAYGSSVGMAFFQSEAVRVRYSTVALNQGGILCGKSCQLEGNIVSENNGFGLDVTTGAAIGNLIMYNAGQGLIGIHKLGYGQNTIEQNGGKQTDGSFVRLFPNACDPGPCP